MPRGNLRKPKAELVGLMKHTLFDKLAGTSSATLIPASPKLKLTALTTVKNVILFRKTLSDPCKVKNTCDFYVNVISNLCLFFNECAGMA
jgi:hypothetical protein